MQSVFQESLELGQTVRKAGSDEGEEEEAAEESNESESSISGEEADDGDLEPSQSSDLASGDTLSEAESDGASVGAGADRELPASDKANNNNNNSGRVLSECSHHLSSDDNYCLFSSRR